MVPGIDIEAHSNTKFPRVEGRGRLNGLIHAVHTAYAHHYPLSLKPDHIWVAVSKAFATHLNMDENSERLRSKFVSHQGQARIVVRDDSLVLGSPNNNWGSVMGQFSDGIAAHIGNQARDMLVSDFSTTTPAEKTVSEVVLMDTMQKYFTYEVLTLCGFPKITLEGTREDWARLRDKARELGKIDEQLDWWFPHLDTFLAEFVNVFDGNVNLPFWKAFYKVEHGSGGPFTSGWINVLFPYIQDGSLRRNTYFPPSSVVHSQGFTDFGGIPAHQYPVSVSVVPFDWTYHGELKKMHLLAGFVAASQDPETLTIHPELIWAIKHGPPPE